MTRQIIRSIIIFWGIIAIFPACYLLYNYVVYNVLPRGDGEEHVTTWLDSNANGIKDPGEKNLPNVCVWEGYSQSDGDDAYIHPDICKNSFTDGNGEWWNFLPGGSCDELFVIAEAPKGFHATTNVVSRPCDTEIGFVQDNVPVNHKVLSIKEYFQQQNTFLLLKRIALGFIIIMIGIIGTIWLEKSPKENGRS
jgi:hypothetical protein